MNKRSFFALAWALALVLTGCQTQAGQAPEKRKHGPQPMFVCSRLEGGAPTGSPSAGEAERRGAI